MKTLWKAAPWMSKVLVVLSAALFFVLSLEPIAHPAAAASSQGIAFTSALGVTIFRVSFGGFPLGCAAFLGFCLFSKRRTLLGLIFSALILGVLLLVRVYGMEVDSTVQQSMPLVLPEIALVLLMLAGVALETRRRALERPATALAGAVKLI